MCLFILKKSLLLWTEGVIPLDLVGSWLAWIRRRATTWLELMIRDEAALGLKMSLEPAAAANWHMLSSIERWRWEDDACGCRVQSTSWSCAAGVRIRSYRTRRRHVRWEIEPQPGLLVTSPLLSSRLLWMRSKAERGISCCSFYMQMHGQPTQMVEVHTQKIDTARTG